MKNTLKTLLVILAVSLLSFTSDKELPENWFRAGSKPNSYLMKLDRTNYASGSSSALIESIDNKIKGFGTLMQSTSAKNYLGKKIKMKGMIKTKDVKKWAGLWLRIDGENREVLGFDNMKKRAIKGTNDWAEYEIVLYVPKNAETINFGGLLVGTGKLWFDDLSFEVVSKEGKKHRLDFPKNLSFDK